VPPSLVAFWLFAPTGDRGAIEDLNNQWMEQTQKSRA